MTMMLDRNPTLAPATVDVDRGQVGCVALFSGRA